MIFIYYFDSYLKIIFAKIFKDLVYKDLSTHDKKIFFHHIEG